MMSQMEGLRKIKALKREFEPGTVFIKEEEDDRAMYILIKGKVQVTQQGHLLDEISESGEYFGEINVLLNIPHVATCRAMTPTTVLEIPAEKIDTFLKNNPEVAINLSRKMARRLIASDKRYLDLYKHLKKDRPQEWLNGT